MKVFLETLLSVVLTILHIGGASVVDNEEVSICVTAEATERRPPDCQGVQKASASPLINGVYIIHPLGLTQPTNVYCDFDTDGGGWTVIQRRLDNSVDFNRTWSDYKEGFGSYISNFWLGNDKISALTKHRGYELRIELLGPTRGPAYAKYYFQVADENHHYQLLLGNYSGTAGEDSFGFHRDMYFTTLDADHDQEDHGNCAQNYGLGGWWYKDCYKANLNAAYLPEEAGFGIQWLDLPGGYGPLKFTEMKIRAL